MKIISLNTWGGRVHKPLFDFFEKHQEVDIFCLQEIYNKSSQPIVEDLGDQFNLYADIQKSLPEHVGYFRPVIPGYGIAIFIKKNINIEVEEKSQSMKFRIMYPGLTIPVIYNTFSLNLITKR